MIDDYVHQDVLPLYNVDSDAVLQSTAERFDFQLVSNPTYERENPHARQLTFSFEFRQQFSATSPDRMYVSDIWRGKKTAPYGNDFETWRNENHPYGYHLWSGGTHGSPLRRAYHGAIFVQYPFRKNSFSHLSASEGHNRHQYRHAARTHHLTPVLCCDENCSCLWMLPHDMAAYGPFEADPVEENQRFAPTHRPVFLDYYDVVYAQQQRQFLTSMTNTEALDALPPSTNFPRHLREFFHGQHSEERPLIKKRKWGVVAWPDRRRYRSVLRKLDMWGAFEIMKRLPVVAWSHVLTFLPFNEKCVFSMFYDDSTLQAYGCMTFERVLFSENLLVHLQHDKMQELHKWRGRFDLMNFCSRHIHRTRTFHSEFRSGTLNALVAKLQIATCSNQEAMYQMITTDKEYMTPHCIHSFDGHIASHKKYMTAWVDLNSLLHMMLFSDEPENFADRACWYVKRVNAFHRLYKAYCPNAKSLTRLIAGELTKGDCALHYDLRMPYKVHEEDNAYCCDVHSSVTTIWRQLSDMISLDRSSQFILMQHVYQSRYFHMPCPYDIGEVERQMNFAMEYKSNDHNLGPGEERRADFLYRHTELFRPQPNSCEEGCKCCGCPQDLMIDALAAWHSIQKIFHMQLTDTQLRDLELSPVVTDITRTARYQAPSAWDQYVERFRHCKVHVVRPGMWRHKVTPPQAWGIMDMLIKLREEQREDDDDLWAE